MGCSLYETLGLDCWSGPRCADCPTAEWAGPDDPADAPEQWSPAEQAVIDEAEREVFFGGADHA